MGSATSHIPEFANRIVAYEAQQCPSPLSQTDCIVRVCEKLRLHLIPLIGAAGYHALISRTIALLKKDHPWSVYAGIKPDGALDFSLPEEPEASAGFIPGDAVAIPARLLGLLATFIGEPLTLNLALEVWPLLPKEAAGEGRPMP
jgi:hypothetical protein